MARPKGKDTGRVVYWLVITQVHRYLVEASNRDEVIPTMLRKLGYSGKDYLAKDWKVRLPKPEEVEHHLKRGSDKGQAAIAHAVKRQGERWHLHAFEED
jgi:hypothetical protein